MEFLQLPVGVIQICCTEPGPSISATVNVVPALITTLGLSFHPCPRSRAAPSPVPFVAMPPFPFAPLKFSGLIDLLLASDIRKILLIFVSIPLNLPCAIETAEYTRQNKRQPLIFIFININLAVININIWNKKKPGQQPGLLQNA